MDLPALPFAASFMHPLMMWGLLAAGGYSMFLGIGEEYWLRLYQFIHLIVVGTARVEWRETNYHLICQNTESPPINSE